MAADEKTTPPPSKPSPIKKEEAYPASESTFEQDKVEADCRHLYLQIYEEFMGVHVCSASPAAEETSRKETMAFLTRLFNKSVHVEGLLRMLTSPLPSKLIILDASKPWIVYWITHSLNILGEWRHREHEQQAVIEFISQCQCEGGGFGGGPGQLPHLATTYAAVAALASIGTEAAMSIINREALKSFLIRMRVPGKGFRLQEDGESDTRGIYCAIAAAGMTRVLCPELTDGIPEWVGKCQRYDGGIAGEPGGESHAGYTYCGLAAVCTITSDTHKYINLDKLLTWLCSRQMPVEGGFQGRPSKLVDVCYSFWCAATHVLVKLGMFKANGGSSSFIYPKAALLYSPLPLVAYITLCCQPSCVDLSPEALPLPILIHQTSSEISGDAGLDDSTAALPHHSAEEARKHHPAKAGFRDKPRKTPDYYHTAYALSGLSLTMEWWSRDEMVRDETFQVLKNKEFRKQLIDSIPELGGVHPLYNVCYSSLKLLRSHYLRDDGDLPPPPGELDVDSLLEFESHHPL